MSEATRPSTPDGKSTRYYHDCGLIELPTPVLNDLSHHMMERMSKTEQHPISTPEDGYFVEHFLYQLELQDRNRADPEYTRHRPFLNRPGCLNIIFFVVETLSLTQNVFVHAANLFDRFASEEYLQSDQYERVAVACLYMAMNKNTREQPLGPEYFLALCHTTPRMSVEDLKRTEFFVLPVLDHDLIFCYPYYFLNILIADEIEDIKTVSGLILQSMFFNPGCMYMSPTLMVSCCLYMSRLMFPQSYSEVWSQKDAILSHGIVIEEFKHWVPFFTYELAHITQSTELYWSFCDERVGEGHLGKDVRRWARAVFDHP